MALKLINHTLGKTYIFGQGNSITFDKQFNTNKIGLPGEGESGALITALFGAVMEVSIDFTIKPRSDDYTDGTGDSSPTANDIDEEAWWVLFTVCAGSDDVYCIQDDTFENFYKSGTLRSINLRRDGTDPNVWSGRLNMILGVVA